MGRAVRPLIATQMQSGSTPERDSTMPAAPSDNVSDFLKSVYEIGGGIWDHAEQAARAKGITLKEQFLSEGIDIDGFGQGLKALCEKEIARRMEVWRDRV